MLPVDQEYIDEIQTAIALLKETGEVTAPRQQLRESLHRAMRLEASTIPPYLVAAWSIQDSAGYQNAEIRALIMGVAREEMLHMMGAMNIIAALGESLNVATNEIVLDWGTDMLPIGGGIVPSLAPFSTGLLTDVFMRIEEPKNPIHYVILDAGPERVATDFATIGKFYEALIELINSFEIDPFTDGANFPQIKFEHHFGLGLISHAPIADFEIKSRAHAIEVLKWIVDQGEGSAQDPLDGDGNPAHYYRFAEIYKQGKLVAADDQPLGYAYDRGNFPIICDFNRVRQFDANPKMENFPEGSRHLRGLQVFNQRYTRMFDELQQFYDGGGEQLVRDSINTMGSMTTVAENLLELDPSVCPSFEWMSD